MLEGSLVFGKGLGLDFALEKLYGCLLKCCALHWLALRYSDVLAVLNFSRAQLLEFFLRQRCIKATCPHCLHHSG